MGYFFSLSKSTTEHCLNASELLLLVCGAVLAFGAAGEYLEEHDVLPRWMRWSREPKLVFVWMVAISLIGEFAGDAGVYLFSGHLQSIADQEIKDANSRALDAKTSAERAAAAAGIAINSLVIVGREAGDAHTVAQSASDIAIPAKKTAEAAKGEAASAKSKADAVGVQAGTLTSQMSSATQELAKAEAAEQKEEQALTDMSVCLAPRVIPEEGIFNPVTKTETWSTLALVRPFSNLQAIIDVAPDAEARRAASSIEIRLHDAGWKRVTMLQGVDGLKDGVEIIPWSPREFGNKQLGTPEGQARLRRNLEANRAVSQAGEAIRDWLHDFNWIATKSMAPNPDIPTDAIEIRVGLYPAVQFVVPPGDKAFADATAAGNKQREEALEKMRAEDDKEFEDLMKQRSPEGAAKAREAREQTRELVKKWHEQDSQPCRLVDPFSMQ
jgi:hypothetical protein